MPEVNGGVTPSGEQKSPEGAKGSAAVATRFRIANEAVMRAGQYAYATAPQEARVRALWIARSTPPPVNTA